MRVPKRGSQVRAGPHCTPATICNSNRHSPFVRILPQESEAFVFSQNRGGTRALRRGEGQGVCSHGDLVPASLELGSLPGRCPKASERQETRETLLSEGA